MAGGKCFAAGTLVLTARGLLPIEQVDVGELVLARDDETGEIGYKPVVATFETPNQEVMNLHLEIEDGATETFTVTPGHPFWAQHRGWVDAFDLQPGDVLFTSKGGWARVSSASWVEGTQTVYNFEVADWHTYFVGDDGVWVHNQCVNDRIAKALASANPDTQLEVQVAASFGDDVVNFRQRLGRHGSRGEIDVGTSRFVIEVANGIGKKKLTQLRRLAKQPEVGNREVVLFVKGPVPEAKRRTFAEAGFRVVNRLTDLID